MYQIIRRERWPGQYVSGQRVYSVPLITPGQLVPANQPVLRLEQGENGKQDGGQTGGLTERRDEVVPAGLAGRALDTTPRGGVLIESVASIIPGRLGFGNQIAGVLTTMHMQDESGMSGAISSLPAGAILAIPEPLTFAVVRRAIISGVTGIIGGSMAQADLEGFLHADLLSVLDSINVEQTQAQLPAMTLLLTEGVGNTPMSATTYQILERYNGAIVLMSGVTSTRYHLTPELLISSQQEYSGQDLEQAKQTVQPEDALYSHMLQPGMWVRVCAGDYEGATGRITYFFLHEQLFPSGVRSRAVRLQLDDGASVMVPLMHVQAVDGL